MNLDTTGFYSSESSENFTIKLPQAHKARVALWKHLNANNLDSLLACFEIDDMDEFKSQLNSNELRSLNTLSAKRSTESSPGKNQFAIFSRLVAVQLGLNLNDERDAIMVDKYYFLIKFGLRHSFSKEMISALIIILKQVNEVARDTSFGNLDHVIDYFRQILLCYSVHRPPHSLKLFSPNQTDLIINYFLKSYLNQFKLFKFIYTKSIRLSFEFIYSELPNDAEKLAALTTAQETANEFQNESIIGDVRSDSRASVKSNFVGGVDVTLGESDKKQRELKEFVKSYLNNRLDKMKVELTSEIRKDSAGNEKSLKKQPKAPSSKPKSPKK